MYLGISYRYDFHYVQIIVVIDFEQETKNKTKKSTENSVMKIIDANSVQMDEKDSSHCRFIWHPQ